MPKTSYDYSRYNRTLFIDTSNIEEIKKWNKTGVISGVTTNQAIMLKDGVKPKDFERTIKAIAKEMGDLPVSVELSDSTATVEQMLKEAKKYDAMAKNIVVKVPMIPETTKSLEVITNLAKMDIAVNVTTMMTYEQMVMAILATSKCRRPSFVSFFWGRSAEDHASYRSRFDFMKNFARVGMGSPINETPAAIVDACARFLMEGGYQNPKIIVGSIRSATQVGEAFDAGANVPTVPPDILQAMLFSQRSIETIEQFDIAWKELQALT
jgi:transaldolase